MFGVGGWGVFLYLGVWRYFVFFGFAFVFLSGCVAFLLFLFAVLLFGDVGGMYGFVWSGFGLKFGFGGWWFFGVCCILVGRVVLLFLMGLCFVRVVCGWFLCCRLLLCC